MRAVVVRHSHEVQSSVPVVEATVFIAFVLKLALVQKVGFLRLRFWLELIQSVQQSVDRSPPALAEVRVIYHALCLRQLARVQLAGLQSRVDRTVEIFELTLSGFGISRNRLLLCDFGLGRDQAPVR